MYSSDVSCIFTIIFAQSVICDDYRPSLHMAIEANFGPSYTLSHGSLPWPVIVIYSKNVKLQNITPVPLSLQFYGQGRDQDSGILT